MIDNEPRNRAVLLSPAYEDAGYIRAESLGIRAIAAVLAQEGAEITVVDEVPVIDEFLQEKLTGALFVGIGVLFTRQIPAALTLAREIRELDARVHICIGGQGTAFLWQRVLEDAPWVDSCCMYEGEEVVQEVWKQLVQGNEVEAVDGLFVRASDGQVASPKRARNPVLDLDALPYVWRAYEGPRTSVTMYTSRGCAAHCSFCQSGNYGNRYHKLPKWRSRTFGHILGEIETLLSKGVRAISFVDDDFLGGDGRGRDRAREFAAEIKSRELNFVFSIECRVDEIDYDFLEMLTDVGLRHILIGVESANYTDDRLYAKKVTQNQITTALKNLRQLNLDFSVGFIMFHPLTTLANLSDNLAFLSTESIASYRRITNRLELYPGAPLLSYFRRRGVEFTEDSYRLYYDFADPDVASIYSIMRTELRPLERLENVLSKIRFRLDAQGRGYGDPLFHNYQSLASHYATLLIDRSRDCIAGTAAEELDNWREDLSEKISTLELSLADLTNAINSASGLQKVGGEASG